MQFLRLRSFFFSLVVLSAIFTSCKQLDSEKYDLSADCKTFAQHIVDSLPVDKKNIYYVEVDTLACKLLVRYDSEYYRIEQVRGLLERNEYLFYPLVDSVLAEDIAISDSLIEESNVLRFDAPAAEKIEEDQPEDTEATEQADSIEVETLNDSVSSAILDSIATDSAVEN